MCKKKKQHLKYLIKQAKRDTAQHDSTINRKKIKKFCKEFVVKLPGQAWLLQLQYLQHPSQQLLVHQSWLCGSLFQPHYQDKVCHQC